MYTRYKQEIASKKATGAYRYLRDISNNGLMLSYEGREYINFSSNDYLGLSSRTHLWQQFIKEIGNDESFMGGSCSSRLLSGNSHPYFELENYLATSHKREAALVFNSGYHANIGILPALANKNDLILADKLVHASIIDGLMLGSAKVVRYKHNDYKQLQQILDTERCKHEQVFVVTESVFSMDGDRADLQALVELKSKYNLLLYIDEAHAVGVLGQTGLGLCEELGLINHIDFIVGTFGKAVASQGAYLICDQIIHEYLVNTMRSLIFTTALPPISLKWTLFCLKTLAAMQTERAHLAILFNKFKEELALLGFETRGNSPIVPVIIGENVACVNFATALQNEGIFVLPVRPPTVPEGTARLRFSLTASMQLTDIIKVIEILKQLRHAI